MSDLGPIPLTSYGQVAAGSDGRAHVAGSTGITVVDTAAGSTHTIAVELGLGTHVAVDGDGHIYFTGVRYDSAAGTSRGYLSILDASGSVIVTVDLGDLSDHAVTGLALGPDGRIYVSGYDNGASNGTLTIFHSDGTVDTSILLAGMAPAGVAVGADGTAYILGNGRVIAVDSTGPIGPPN